MKIMDQVKIGKFIAECRRGVGLTQMQLAEKLNITDRAVSKWETGRAMPDSSIMLELCRVLKINVNDLLCGERVIMEKYNSEAESTLVEMVKQKEDSDRRLLQAEILIGIFAALPIVASVIVVLALSLEEWVGLTVILCSLIPLLVALPFLIRIEQVAGYYECSACGHRYVPPYKSIFMARHIGRKRKLKCPNCQKKCWHSKVIKKDEE